ncbi:PIN domain nuclease [Uniformispora flossi]|uniref:PIN domain nuclease n=1 Tax=Uniformispora flossi TaxID=3390723 RepID=UPI003C2C8945
MIDSSAAVRMFRPKVEDHWHSAARQGRVAMCAPTELELQFSARSRSEFQEMREQFEQLYAWQVVPEDGWSSAQRLQRDLLDAGAHRSAGVVDLLVAVTALRHRLTVLHYDRDFDTIAKVTGQQVEWLASPGSLN